MLAFERQRRPPRSPSQPAELGLELRGSNYTGCPYRWWCRHRSEFSAPIPGCDPAVSGDPRPDWESPAQPTPPSPGWAAPPALASWLGLACPVALLCASPADSPAGTVPDEASTHQPGEQWRCPRARLPSSCSVSPLWAASNFYFCLPPSLLPFTYHGHYQTLHLES